MKFNKLLLAMMLTGASAPAVLAEESVDTTAAEELVDTTTTAEVPAEVLGEQSDKDVVQVEEDVDTLDVVEGKLDRYITKVKSSLEKSGKAHKVFVYSGTAELSVSSSDPRWSKYRERALEKAVLDARISYLSTLNTSPANNVIYSMNSMSGLPIPTVDDFKTDSQMEGFLDKVIAVIDGKLDSELKEMGIDPKQFNAAPPAIKRDLYKESVVEQTARTSYGDLSGMVVVKQYEEITESGHGTIGVVMILSATKRDEIKAMIESHGEVAPQPEKANTQFSSLQQMFSSKKDSLYLKAGTDVLYDSEGYPLIVAYGQSGVTYSKSSTKKKIERKVAKEFATNNAWANLTRAYNLNGDLKSSTSVEAQESESEKFELIIDSVRSTSSGLTQSMYESMEKRASMQSSMRNMTGVSVEYDWRRKHPVTGHEMVGSVLVWHPKKVTNAKNLASGKSEAQLDQAVQEEVVGSRHSAESEDTFDAADF
ncbi:DUF6844 domain-containing protein [Vibrio gallaecicus]|uniref:DUF6844 domain-containing protein n=1 Tax=Vibrio gallaecicus TaxID=552386 RepID=A0ABV4NAD9_9VIBR